MGREIENFCEKWMGYLMRPRPPPNLPGVSFAVVPCAFGLPAGLSALVDCRRGCLPWWIAGMVQIYLNFVRKCAYLLNN